MNGDFSELIEYLDRKFNDINGKFKSLPELFPVKDEVVTKNDFEELRADFRSLQSSVDAYAVRADTFFQELVMLSHKVDRHKNGFCKLQKNLE